MNTDQNTIRVAYGSVPKDGGTFTFYRNIRPHLLEYGIDLRCVSVGRKEGLLWEDEYIDEGCFLIEPKTRRIKKQSMAFSRWVEDEGIDIVLGLNSPGILSAIPHLPRKVRIMSRCANSFEHGYKITMSGRERLAAIVATTPRLQHDLIKDYGASPDSIHLIPNGIESSAFNQAASRPRGTSDTLNIGFLGRLEHNQKGVFHIPPIVQELNRREVKFKLRIAGKGKHRKTIEQAMQKEIASGQVQFLGAIPPAQVPLFLGSNDLFLFTSHFEGCPNALLEALMAGCVPVAWKIDGITDYIISEGETGFLCEVGDYLPIGAHIERLENNRSLLSSCSTKASSEARARFDSKATAKAYATVFHSVMSMPPPSYIPKKWSDFSVDTNFTRPLIQRIVTGIQDRLGKAGAITKNPESNH